MTAFAQTLHRQQQEAAVAQASDRTKRRVVHRSPVVIEPLGPIEPRTELCFATYNPVRIGSIGG